MQHKLPSYSVSENLNFKSFKTLPPLLSHMGRNVSYDVNLHWFMEERKKKDFCNRRHAILSVEKFGAGVYI